MRLAIALFLCLSVANAADVPQSSRRDNRIQYVNYSAQDVVLVHATVGYVSRIVFEQGETIVSIHSGFADGWDISASGRIMTLQPISVALNDETTLKPNIKDWRTNVAVETTKRLYDFDVRLLPEGYAGDDAQVFYRIEFLYPVEEAEKAKADVARRLAAVERRTPIIPRNHEYYMRAGKRSNDIAPTAAFDDGLFTYLRFPNNRDLPTVFLVSPDGQEGKINTHIHNDYPDLLVVQRVARELVLRLGDSVVTIVNRGFDMDGRPPQNGTTIPNAERLTRSKEAS